MTAVAKHSEFSLLADLAREDENGCWIWKGTRTNGYGVRGGKYAHRLSWEMTYGAIPEGMMVCHHCDRPPCVNPEHLFLGTQLDNMQDASRKGRLKLKERRAYLEECRHGHPFTEENTYWFRGGQRCRACRARAARDFRARRR